MDVSLQGAEVRLFGEFLAVDCLWPQDIPAGSKWPTQNRLGPDIPNAQISSPLVGSLFHRGAGAEPRQSNLNLWAFIMFIYTATLRSR